MARSIEGLDRLSSWPNKLLLKPPSSVSSSHRWPREWREWRKTRPPGPPWRPLRSISCLTTGVRVVWVCARPLPSLMALPSLLVRRLYTFYYLLSVMLVCLLMQHTVYFSGNSCLLLLGKLYALDYCHVSGCVYDAGGSSQLSLNMYNKCLNFCVPFSSIYVASCSSFRFVYRRPLLCIL